jgi:CNT family concentrative nucleoside transporter
MGSRFVSLLGIFLIVAFTWIISTNRRRVSWPLVIKGLLLQATLALILFKTSWGQVVLVNTNGVVGHLLDAGNAGTAFVFGPLADSAKIGGFIIFVQYTGIVVFMGAFSTALYHVGILQLVVGVMARLMRVTLGTSGAESLVAAINMFVGQDESALFIRPYLRDLTPSEVMALMTVGMGTIASGVLVVYSDLLGRAGLPNAGGHLLAASVLSAPASLVIAKILVPETGIPKTSGRTSLEPADHSLNVFDALCHGATEGFRMSMNIMAMLIAFVALLHLVDDVAAGLGSLCGFKAFRVEALFGYIFRPVALIMGIPAADAPAVGGLLGERMVVNEFLAYSDLAALIHGRAISPRSALISTYALCGFANFTSIAIQMGGIGTLEPSLRPCMARSGLRAMIGGTLATVLSGCLAGLLT